VRIERTKKPQTAIGIEPWGLAFITATALVIFALTLRTWVDFNIAHLRGTDADAMTNLGDGYLVMTLGVFAIGSSAALYLRPKYWMTFLPAIGLFAVSIAAIAGFEAATPWNASGSDMHGVAFVTGGHATAAVYEVSALAVLMGVTAAVLAGIHYRRLSAESGLSVAELTHSPPLPAEF
jgi:hypothetical protein